MFLFIDLDPCYRSLALLPGNRLGPNGLLSVSQPGRPVPYNRLLLEAAPLRLHRRARIITL
jgi:hypothetical protein